MILIRIKQGQCWVSTSMLILDKKLNFNDAISDVHCSGF